MTKAAAFFAGLFCGVVLATLLVRSPAPTEQQMEFLTFPMLLDDMSMDNGTKWMIFLIKRADWGMCEQTEKLVQGIGGDRFCMRTPLEFQDIK